MFKWVYLIWGFLPMIFLYFGIQALIKRYYALPEQEDPGYYFSQTAFCLFALVVTICVDIWILDPTAGEDFYGFAHTDAVRWLLYPILLAVLAWVQRAVFKEKQKAAASGPRVRFIQ